MAIAPGLGQRYYDLSDPIYEGMPYFPLSFPVEVEQAASVDAGGFNVHRITMGTHHDTHVDAPRHRYRDGRVLDEIDLNKFMGEGIVLDFSQKEIGSGIGADELEKYSHLVHADEIVILYTGCSTHIGEERVRSKYTYLQKNGAEWLVEKKAKSVGIDFFSVDAYGSAESPAHSLLLASGIPIIEEISAEARHLAGRRIYLFCLPLRMMMGDGAPARVIAYLLE